MVPGWSRGRAEATDRSGHRDVARVLATLDGLGVRPEVRHLDDAVRTAKAAAAALGVTVGEIANSLVFAGRYRDGRLGPVLVLTAGDHRVDLEKVADLADLAALERASADQVRAWTGFAIGGVAPVGHLTTPLTIVDVSLSRHSHVWAAAGHSHSVFRTSYDELLRVTGGVSMEVA